MKAVSNIMLSGAAIAALVTAAPAAAQYYPNQSYGQGYGNNNVVGQILNSILGGRSYGRNDRYAIDMCVRATEARLNGYQGGYGYGSYGSYGGYGNQGYNQGYGGARVTAVTLVERRSNGGLKVHGNASAGYARQGYGDHHSPYNQGYGGYSQGYGGYNQGYGGYNQGYGYNNAGASQLTFHCKVNSRGQVTDVDIDRRRDSYRYNGY